MFYILGSVASILFLAWMARTEIESWVVPSGKINWRISTDNENAKAIMKANPGVKYFDALGAARELRR